MATVTPLLDTRVPRKKGVYPVVVKVSHKGKLKHLPTGFSIEVKYWTGSRVSAKHADADIINAKLSEVIGGAEKYIADCKLHNKPVHLEALGGRRHGASFTGYLSARIDHYKQKKQHVQARKVERYKTELIECFGREVFFEDLTKDALRKLEAYMITNKNIGNTRLRKFARLRQFYDNAAEEGKVQAPNPFNTYHIAGSPPKKEKLTETEVEAIEKIAIPDGPINDARNLFLFSYYCKGARFENCVMMLKSHVQTGRIGWRINKGKRFLSVKIHGKLQAILDRYKDHQGEFIFPFVDKIRNHTTYGPAIIAYVKNGGEILEGKDPAYIKMIDVLNVTVGRYLDEVARLVELNKPLNFHIARHSFAFHLKKKTDSISVIQDSLGHKDQRTTEIYLQTLDDERLDSEMDKLYGE